MHLLLILGFVFLLTGAPFAWGLGPSESQNQQTGRSQFSPSPILVYFFHLFPFIWFFFFIFLSYERNKKLNFGLIAGFPCTDDTYLTNSNLNHVSLSLF
ncbi:Uncharacterized protein TCM_008354 [Theobroma cacao]|uniref:Uncharacterized protein n=1 Tax=Theobroma cacao TaxID=3641 RepID=A0A061E4U7_THECC|nr:Uncharacterized protein TCM_008354 [Theobroma cacao]